MGIRLEIPESIVIKECFSTYDMHVWETEGRDEIIEVTRYSAPVFVDCEPIFISKDEKGFYCVVAEKALYKVNPDISGVNGFKCKWVQIPW